MSRAAKRRVHARSERMVRPAEADIGRHMHSVLGRLYQVGSIGADELRAGAEIGVAMELARLGTASCAVVDPSRIVVDGGPGFRGDPLRAPRLRLVTDLGRWAEWIDRQIPAVGGVTPARIMYAVVVGAVPEADDMGDAGKGRRPGSLRYLETSLGVRNGSLVGPVSNALRMWINKPWERQRSVTTIR
jgi:hypothetical protein